MPAPDSGTCQGRHLPYPAHFDAQMMGLQEHRDAMWMEHPFEGVRHLLPDPFLDGKSLGEQAHEPCQLGDADDIFVCDVTDVCIAEEREGVMLA